MKDILKQVSDYYTTRIEAFGATPQGVDWNSEESQQQRFEVLSKSIERAGDFSVLDYGCGFGSMFGYLDSRYASLQYYGFDISDKMIVAAKAGSHGKNNAQWSTELPAEKRDYVIASGIFNVKLDNTQPDWLAYILETIHKMDEYSSAGFAFNVLTAYSDKEFMKDYLYYADPLFLFDYCKKHFSRNVALLHDYNLYEFTIIVKK